MPALEVSLTAEDMREHFPQFDIMECLGRGGMGIVYKARQLTLDRTVAIKVLAGGWQGDVDFARRFEREAKILAQMSHPNIVTVHDFGEANGLYYIVMEYVDGVNLRDLLADGKMDPKQALAIVPPVCEALEYAHDKGVVHRDIKPENLLLDREGRVKIADFGIASLVGASGEKSGTPPYMAPEQEHGTVDRRADIYALGAVLYEMLTGDRPGKPIEPPSRKIRVDVRLDEIVLRALEREPERRYQTAAEFRTVVETVVLPREPTRADAMRGLDARWKYAMVAMLMISGAWLTGLAMRLVVFDKTFMNILPLTLMGTVFIVALFFLAIGLRKKRPEFLARMLPYNYILLASFFGYQATSQGKLILYAGSVVMLICGIKGFVKAQQKKTTRESPEPVAKADESASSPLHAAHLPRTAIIVLFVILILCGFYTGWRTGTGRRSQAWGDAVRAHHTAVKNCLKLGEEVCNRVVMATKKTISLADFENEFGPVTRINPEEEHPDSAKDATHTYVHKESYRIFYLRFEDGILVTCGSSHGVDDIQPHLPSIDDRISKMM